MALSERTKRIRDGQRTPESCPAPIDLVKTLLGQGVLIARLKKKLRGHALLRQGATALFDALQPLALPGKGENAWFCLSDREIRRVLKPFRKALNRVEGSGTKKAG